MGLVEDLDRFQRRTPLVAFTIAVIYKFVEDRGNYLAAVLTYYAFVAIFPLLLIASSVLGFVIQGDPGLQKKILDSALSQFPIVGDQLGRPDGITGSVSAVVVGALAALYGVIGLGQASLQAMHTVWGIPFDSRPNPLLSRLRALLVFLLAGLALLVISVLTTVGASIDRILPGLGPVLPWLVRVTTVALNTLVVAALFRWATAKRPPLRALLPGALLVAIAWQLLQAFGAVYVQHVLTRVSAMNSIFALVLGLLALIYLTALAAILGAEVNVVRMYRLYPRALMTPFTDDVELTPADRRVYRGYAKAQRRKGFERVDVSFEDGACEQPKEPFAP